MNREAWLGRVVRALRPRFRAAGYPLPERIAASCGWPSKGGEANDGDEGQYWAGSASPDGTINIFISPLLSDGVKVADVLAHELVHAALDHLADPGHKGEFLTAMRALGLVGRPVAAHAGRALRRELTTIVERVGPYPHAGLRL